MPALRRLLAAVTHSDPSDTLPPLPRRGDPVEAWLRAQRDQRLDAYGRPPEWHQLDDLLDLYRLHADTGTPLDQALGEVAR
jgi:hypothetical protein